MLVVFSLLLVNSDQQKDGNDCSCATANSVTTISLGISSLSDALTLSGLFGLLVWCCYPTSSSWAN